MFTKQKVFEFVCHLKMSKLRRRSRIRFQDFLHFQNAATTYGSKPDPGPQFFLKYLHCWFPIWGQNRINNHIWVSWNFVAQVHLYQNFGLRILVILMNKCNVTQIRSCSLSLFSALSPSSFSSLLPYIFLFSISLLLIFHC